jgi:hypothetical protein
MIHQFASYYLGCRAVTVEHDQKWIDFFLNSTEVKINVKNLSLASVQVQGYQTSSYSGLDIFRGEKFDFILIDGPIGTPHYARAQLLDLAPWFLAEEFCVFMDDTERVGDKETMAAFERILIDSKLEYRILFYQGEKNQHSLICSPRLAYLGFR